MFIIKNFFLCKQYKTISNYTLINGNGDDITNNYKYKKYYLVYFINYTNFYI